MELAHAQPLTSADEPTTAAPRPSGRASRVSGSTAAVDRECPLRVVRDADVFETRLLVPADAIVELHEPAPVAVGRRSEVAARAVNVVLALLALAVALPVMLLVALAVRLTSRGPVLYTQVRVGLNRRGRRHGVAADRRAADHGGRLFTIYKFRSMRVDAEADGEAVWATQNDARVTPIGAVLRATRLDELPQLFNVLRGDMNIVGPRPERPSIFARLCEDIEEYPLRQLAKPGITGWAQINHTYDTSVEDVRVKVRYDLEYLTRQNIWTDLVIMARTVPVMLSRKSGW